MEIKDLLKRKLMIMELKSSNKMDVIDEIAQKFFDEGIVGSKEEFKEGIIKREEETSTALGEGIAMPHAKVDTVKEPAVLFAKKSEGVDYEAFDGEDSFSGKISLKQEIYKDLRSSLHALGCDHDWVETTFRDKYEDFISTTNYNDLKR